MKFLFENVVFLSLIVQVLNRLEFLNHGAESGLQVFVGWVLLLNQSFLL